MTTEQPWTAPAVTRIDEPFVADERTMLLGWLGWQRSTLLHKCAGLTGEQLAMRPLPATEMSLLGLIRHHTDVERVWLRRRLEGRDDMFPTYHDGERETAWSDLDPTRAEENYAALLAEWEICDEVLARHDLDDLFETPRHGTMSCRWVVVHLIEEYARHNGHADLLREHIDGVTGS
jgi:uncharacterized damage-inducible protein DinB